MCTHSIRFYGELHKIILYMWAWSSENVSCAICEQQRCRTACTSAQSDQHLCCSLLRKYDTYTCSIQSFKILISFCSWAGWFESYPVENPRRQVFAWCGSCNYHEISHDMTKPTKWVSVQRRLRSDWVDLSLRWVHSHFDGFVMSRLKCPRYVFLCVHCYSDWQPRFKNFMTTL